MLTASKNHVDKIPFLLYMHVVEYDSCNNMFDINNINFSAMYSGGKFEMCFDGVRSPDA